MKIALKITIPFLLLFFITTNLQAFVTVTNLHSNTTIPESEYFTVNEFLELTPAKLEAATGKKAKWGQRMWLKVAQKRMLKKLKKGKVQPTDIAIEKGGGYDRGMFSAITGGASILALLLVLYATPSAIPVLLVVSIILAVIAIVTGLANLSRGGRNLVGLVAGLLTLLLMAIYVFVIIPLVI